MSSSLPYDFAASDVEHTLRNGGHLVYADPLRRAIWCFFLPGAEGSSASQSGEGEPLLGPTLDVCGHKIAMVDEGTLEPISLLKNRIMTPNAMNTPSSSSPSGPGLDTALRPATTTPGGVMNSASFSSEADPSSSYGSAADPKGYGSIPTRDIHQYFITSVLATLSQRFCSKTGAIPVDSKSLLLPSESASADPEISPLASSASIFASLRVHLTTAGSLLIGISLTHAQGVHAASDGLSPPLPPSAGTTVLAAPLGIFGTFQGFSDVDQYSLDGSTVQTPDTQVTRWRPDVDGRPSQWRSTCYKMLETRGISSTMLSKSSWLSIQYLRRKPNESKADGRRTPMVNPHTHIMWPAVLCYRKRSRNPQILRDGLESGRPGNTAFRDDFDAMKNARTWFMSNGEREELLAKRQADREAASASKTVVDPDPRLPQSGFSPHVPRRTSNSGPVGGTMYPTPPDGVQTVAGVTPSIDGTTSSPGNPVPTAAMVDIDTAIAAPGSLGDPFGDGWDGPDTKREQSFNQENWDLNNDVFVETDITDADFNFFDEQPSAMDVSVPDIPNADAGLTDLGSSGQPARIESQQSSGHTTLKTECSPAPPVFAKPELKHARSILGREKARPPPSHGIKRQASPFDPVTVYKRLKASLGSGHAASTGSTTGPSRRGSAFDKLDFDRSLTVVNRKYEHNGRFDFREDSQEDNESRGPGLPPTTNYLRRHGKGRTTLTDLPRNLGAQIAGMTGAIDGNVQSDPARADESTSDADDVSLVSDHDDMSDFSDEPSSPTKMSSRRRRLADDNESVAPSLKDAEIMDEQAVSSSVDLSRLSLSDSLEIPATRYFADFEPIVSPRPPQPQSDEEFIMAAQILTEQAVSGCLNYALPDLMHGWLDISGPQGEVTHSTRSSLQILQAVLPPCLQSAAPCQLRQLIDVQDVPLLATPSRIQPRPPAGGPEQRPSLVQINPPHLELRRYQTKLSVLPSAVNFWESLGLGPSQGPKDIHSVCVFPNLEGLSDSAGVFLDRLRSVYESLKLGSFERMPSSQTILNGLLSLEPEAPPTNTPLSTQANPPQAAHPKPPRVDDMAKLAVALFNLAAVPKNFVIFFVYTPDDPSTIVDACLAFQRMFELYRRALTERKKLPAQNEVVLQLVPLDMVASPTSMVVLPSSDCMRLCLEVYDRCTMFGGPMPSPSVVLEQQPITQGINFQLRNQPSANILQENSMMHIAYAQSVDERWITAAWTDNRGSKQMTASYCLGRKGKPLSRSFTDVALDIWTSTHDLTSIWKVHWRIIITKVGTMNQEEISDWQTLAQTEMKSSVTLSLLTVNTNPSLQLIPAIPKVSMAAQSSFYSTPVSTPQPSTMSPEHVGNPPTPKGGFVPGGASTPGADNTTETDADASLVDVTDTVWGAVASHRLNTSQSLTDPSPALISGYLIKRGGSRADDPPAVMEINVIHCDGNPRMHEVLLREILYVFRGLATIARARSVTEKEGDVRPWHVAAAEKGVRALYQLM